MANVCRSQGLVAFEMSSHPHRLARLQDRSVNRLHAGLAVTPEQWDLPLLERFSFDDSLQPGEDLLVFSFLITQTLTAVTLTACRAIE